MGPGEATLIHSITKIVSGSQKGRVRKMQTRSRIRFQRGNLAETGLAIFLSRRLSSSRRQVNGVEKGKGVSGEWPSMSLLFLDFDMSSTIAFLRKIDRLLLPEEVLAGESEVGGSADFLPAIDRWLTLLKGPFSVLAETSSRELTLLGKLPPLVSSLIVLAGPVVLILIHEAPLVIEGL